MLQQNDKKQRRVCSTWGNGLRWNVKYVTVQAKSVVFAMVQKSSIVIALVKKIVPNALAVVLLIAPHVNPVLPAMDRDT